MKIVLWILALLVVLAAVALLIGFAIPAHQTHTRTIALKRSPDAVFTLLTDLPNFPKWNRNLEKIEMLPPINGKIATRQTFKGNMRMTIVTSESTPPAHLVRSLGESGGPFQGSWTYDITPSAEGCEISLKEESEMSNPFFRLMTKLFGPTKYMDEHLEDIAKQFGETATVQSPPVQ